jgi:hypothetical protein
VYAVEDKLPVSGDVVLAKVMPRQVVLDNGGTYELLTLFEDTELDAQLPPGGSPPVAPQVGQSPRVSATACTRIPNPWQRWSVSVPCVSMGPCRAIG